MGNGGLTAHAALVITQAAAIVCAMLSDRDYMQADYTRERPRVLPWLLGVIAVAFVAELVIFSPWFGARASDAILYNTALSAGGLRAGKIWTLLSYPLLHLAGLFEIIFVLASLYALGRALEPLLGPRRFFGIFAGALLLGGLVWVVVNWRHGGELTGSVPGLCGLLVFYACVYPNEPFRLLLLFIFPLTLTPRQLALGVLAVDVFAFGFYEVVGGTMPFGFGYAPSAHLGGMAAGWLCHRIWRGDDWSLGGSRPAVTLPRWLRKSKVSPDLPAPASLATIHAAAPGDGLRAEVDRILDKINADGFGALTAAEKRTLDEAKNLLGRR